jgi:regulator of protease activity HflC (stomatin/prohibitin superfamily)
MGERVEIYKISRETYITSGDTADPDPIEARTIDGQDIFVDVVVIYALDPPKILDLHISWQDRYRDELVRPLARGITRAAMGQYNAFEINAKRLEIVNMISAQLNTKLSENDLILYRFTILNIRQAE